MEERFEMCLQNRTASFTRPQDRRKWSDDGQHYCAIRTWNRSMRGEKKNILLRKEDGESSCIEVMYEWPDTDHCAKSALAGRCWPSSPASDLGLVLLELRNSTQLPKHINNIGRAMPPVCTWSVRPHDANMELPSRRATIPPCSEWMIDIRGILR